jgi:hypothetical protein
LQNETGRRNAHAVSANSEENNTKSNHQANIVRVAELLPLRTAQKAGA